MIHVGRLAAVDIANECSGIVQAVLMSLAIADNGVPVALEGAQEQPPSGIL